jgi:hypothetical protein
VPKISNVAPDARNRLKTKGSDARMPYREAIANLEDGQTLEFEIEGGETLRKIRTNVTLAAKDVGREIQSGETEEGTLLVWLASPTRRRRRRRKVEADPDNLAAQAQ